jgi:predicted Zn-dependent protease
MEKSRETFQRLTERYPGNAVYLTWKGHAERALGSAAAARAAYERAIVLDSALAEPLTELAELELEAGRSDEARALASRALALAPGDARTRFVSGLVWMRLQRWNEAAAVLQEIGSGELEYPQAQYLLSRAWRQLGITAKADAALDEFRRVSGGETAAPGRRRVR